MLENFFEGVCLGQPGSGEGTAVHFGETGSILAGGRWNIGSLSLWEACIELGLEL